MSPGHPFSPPWNRQEEKKPRGSSITRSGPASPSRPCWWRWRATTRRARVRQPHTIPRVLPFQHSSYCFSRYVLTKIKKEGKQVLHILCNIPAFFISLESCNCHSESLKLSNLQTKSHAKLTNISANSAASRESGMHRINFLQNRATVSKKEKQEREERHFRIDLGIIF